VQHPTVSDAAPSRVTRCVGSPVAARLWKRYVSRFCRVTCVTYSMYTLSRDRDRMYGRQQLLWQKQFVVIGSIDLDSQIDEYHTGVAHTSSVTVAVCEDSVLLWCRCSLLQQLFFSVGHSVNYSMQLTCHWTKWRQYHSATVLIYEQLSLALAICFNQFYRRRLFKHLKPRSRWKSYPYDTRLCYLMC